MSDVTSSAPEVVDVVDAPEAAAAGESAEVVLEEGAAEANVDAVAEAVIEEAAFGEDAAEAVVADAVVEEPVVEEPVVEEPVAEAAPVAEAVADEPASAELASDEVAAEAVAADVPAAEEAAAAPVSESVAEALAAGEAASETATAVTTDATGKRVVRTLAVGQEVTGTVKRISEFGAFVDIGVGRDGLVHISELSVKRVGKVTDVIKEGDSIQIWIKKLDRERNRISLTLIPPGTVTIRDLNKDDIVNGTVTRILPYGAFVDIGVGRDALLHVREMGERYIAKPEEIVKVGEQIEAKIIEIQRRRGRIDLSIKGLRPEPEPEPTPYAEQKGDARGKAEAESAAAPEAEQSDPFADLEVLSPFQVALLRAQERSGVELDYDSGNKKNNKQRGKNKQRREQEDIFERTLKTR